MKVSDAVLSRMTCRAFLPAPVPRPVIEEILSLASRAPSSGNLQPWQVWALGGDSLAELKTAVRDKIAQGGFAELPPEYLLYPVVPKEPYTTRRFESGEAMYAALNVDHDDHAGRMRQVYRNYDCFGATTALFFAIDRDMQQGQWAELGMFINSVMLLARERNLDTAAIGAWSLWHRTVHEALNLPESSMLYCGLAIGKADASAPVNNLRTPRAPVAAFATFSGF